MGEPVALLFIVAQHRSDLFTSLKQQFSREEKAGKVQVLLDRRRGNQGETGRPPEPDRRRYFVDEEIRSLGCAIIRR